MTSQNEQSHLPQATQPMMQDPYLLVADRPIAVKTIPHQAGSTKLTAPAGSVLRLLNSDHSGQWADVQITMPENAVVYGWISDAALHALNHNGALLPIADLPPSDYAHNSRQDILALITAIQEQAVDEFRASGRRLRATLQLLVFTTVVAGMGEFFAGGNGLVAFIIGVSALPVWLLWIDSIWRDYNPYKTVQKLQKLQLSKRNHAEIIGDGVKAAAQVAAGGAVAVSLLSFLTAQSKQKHKVYIEHNYRRS